MKKTIEERFWSKVVPTGFCWEWVAGKAHAGHGQFRVNGKVEKAHRVSYRLLIGEIPDGLVLDHLCRNTSCVNPDHLELCTRGENARRQLGGGAHYARSKTKCPQGHEYTEENTYLYPGTGKRACRQCMRDHQNRYYRIRKGGTSSVTSLDLVSHRAVSTTRGR